MCKKYIFITVFTNALNKYFFKRSEIRKFALLSKRYIFIVSCITFIVIFLYERSDFRNFAPFSEESAIRTGKGGGDVSKEPWLDERSGVLE